MPKVAAIKVSTPVIVETAVRVFGSAVKVQLIKHYMTSPGTSAEAAAALGVATRSVYNNTIELVEAGVVIEEPADDKRMRICRVDSARVDELLGALREFAIGEKSS
ncbi:hypothetical protein GCM10009795_096700 [Nocardioides hankookensis]|uniref:ArsR family transcriptional regulator n=1 Tax=Nocardioides hankookensis TaxID=443157 RepID=A0ABW1LNU8_9ACTN